MFLEAFFVLLKQNVKKTTRMAFINADWRDFQNTPAIEEKYKGGILIDDYLDILKKTGWYHTHIIQAPMSSQRFTAGVVSAMQKINNEWLKDHPCSAIIFKNPGMNWKRIQNTYRTIFKDLVIGDLPNENDLIATLQKIENRIKVFDWKI